MRKTDAGRRQASTHRPWPGPAAGVPARARAARQGEGAERGAGCSPHQAVAEEGDGPRSTEKAEQSPSRGHASTVRGRAGRPADRRGRRGAGVTLSPPASSRGPAWGVGTEGATVTEETA